LDEERICPYDVHMLLFKMRFKKKAKEPKGVEKRKAETTPHNWEKPVNKKLRGK